jgi:hypothetical protein
LITDQANLNTVAPGVLQTGLAQAMAAFSPPTDSSALIAQLEAQTTLLAQQLRVSQAQFGAMSGFPFVGAFAAGGITPQSGWALVGERGPELAHLPGGTRVTPNSQLGVGGPIRVEVILQAAIDAKDVKVIASEEARVVIRNEALRSSRMGPGRPGVIR